jgi:hypothetical protein
VSEPQELGNPADDSGTVGGRAGEEFPDGGPPTWVTLSEAAAAVGVSSKAIRRAIKAGTIEGRRSDDSENAPWHVRLDEVEATQPVVASPEPRNEAETVGVEAAEPGSMEAEIVGQPLRGRLSELRKRLVVKEPQRRWWQRSNQ